MPGLAKIAQTDFSGGEWPNTNPERIPPNGAYSITNALVDDVGGLVRRGGSGVIAATNAPADRALWVWDGTLAGGPRTLLATATALYSISGDTFTNLGGYTGMAAGPNRTTVRNGVMYLPGQAVKYDGTAYAASGIPSQAHWTTVSNRLVGATGDTLVFSDYKDPLAFAATDFWKLPGGANTLGLATLRDSAMWFTDQGTFVVSNMALNLTDPDGNVQQRLDLYSPDLVLWGSPGTAGVAGYAGGLIVPARDGVWLVRLGAIGEVPPLQLLSEPLAEQYRDGATSGLRPGQAVVFRGHYLLPLLDSTEVSPLGEVATVLVCRLDRRARPWTEFAGWGAPAALAASRDGGRLLGGMPLYLGATSLGVLGYFDGFPDAADGDGSPIEFMLTTRDYRTGSLNQNTVTSVRLGYRLDSDGDAVVSGFCTRAESDTITHLTPAAPATGGDFSTHSWPVNARTRAMHFDFEVTVPEVTGPGESTKASIQSVEMFVRQQGRA
jgi:hypothetical protein